MIKDLDHDVQIRMQTYSNPKVRSLAIHDIPAPDEKEDLNPNQKGNQIIIDHQNQKEKSKKIRINRQLALFLTVFG